MRERRAEEHSTSGGGQDGPQLLGRRSLFPFPIRKLQTIPAPELFGIDPVASLDFPVLVRRAGLDEPDTPSGFTAH
jgi:hypothetical protein